ncbi:sialin isoform X1 [Patella vulgata]|uniref:sialin isoform X1 n=1 Tax=Patella vulgata TaxID=6465 RepID=UPI00217FAC85|nr:sialin isoform X1 [Patella vulgata]
MANRVQLADDNRLASFPDPSERSLLLQEESKEFFPCLSTRFFLAFMAFLGFVNVYCLRVNLSVAIVKMVNTTDSADNDTVTNECPGDVDNSTTPSSQGEFYWDETTQGVILGSFFYGYITTQIPGGWLAGKIGGRRLFGYGVLCTSALTLLTPVVARWSLPGLIVLRIVEGIGEGVTFPSMHAMFGVWSPILERSKLTSLAYSGAQMGTVISLPISGYLCDSDLAGGWPSVFYIFGALGIVWVIAWLLLIHDTPGQHPRISKAERTHIEESIGKKEDLKTPWKSILTCGPLWGIAAAHFAANWGMYSMLTCLPTYMKQILKFNIKKNSLLSAVPYLALWILQVVSGYLADLIRKNNYMNTLNTRRVLNTSGLLIPAVFMVAVAYSGCNHTLAVVLLTFAVGTGGLSMGGYQVNHLDIAPRFAGTLFGITNAIATIPGFLAPLVVGILTNHQETSEQWRKFFYTTSAIYVVGAVIYLVLAKGEELDWAKSPDKTIIVEPATDANNIQSQDSPHDSDKILI